MRSILATVVLMLSLAVLAACGTDAVNDESDQPGAGETTATDPDLERLAQARARWDAAAIDDYDWSYEQVCYCSALAFDLEVRDAARTGFTPSAGTKGGLSTSPEDLIGAEPGYDTVEDLFEVVDRAIGNEPASLVVEYDDATGYPVRISIDPDEDTYDDEGGVVVTGLTAVDAS